MKKLYHWTPERDEKILRLYDGRKGTTRQIAAALGFPEWCVKKRAARLGRTNPNDRRNWTPEEHAYLTQNAGVMSPDAIARHLGRSLASVLLRAKRERIRLAKERDGYSLRGFAEAMGVDGKQVARWIDRGLLRAAPREREHADFTETEILTFLRAHRDAYRLDRIDQEWFLSLVFDTPAEVRRARAA